MYMYMYMFMYMYVCMCMCMCVYTIRRRLAWTLQRDMAFSQRIAAPKQNKKNAEVCCAIDHAQQSVCCHSGGPHHDTLTTHKKTD